MTAEVFALRAWLSYTGRSPLRESPRDMSAPDLSGAMLAARILEGARRGHLILTIDEVRTMLQDVPADLELCGRRVCDLPVYVIDNIDPYPTIDADEWNRQLVASMADDLLDADDVERLWRRP